VIARARKIKARWLDLNQARFSLERKKQVQRRSAKGGWDFRGKEKVTKKHNKREGANSRLVSGSVQKWVPTDRGGAAGGRQKSPGRGRKLGGGSPISNKL